jgi:Spy/CpxP family protein refolding chaperone
MNKIKLSLIIVAILGGWMTISPIARAADAATEAKPDTKVETQAAAKTDTKANVKADVKTDTKANVKADVKTETKATAQAKRADREQMAKTLKLTDDQKVKIKTIRADERTKLKDLRAKKTDRKEMLKVRQETAAKIKDVLTPEQKEQYSKMEAKAQRRVQKAQKKAAI